jgi:hypothetical protein
MRRIHLLLGIVAAAAIVLGVGAVSSGAKKTSGQTLVVYEVEGSLGFNIVDAAPTSPNPDPASPALRTSTGDQITVASAVRKRNGHQIGSLLEQFIVERGGKLEESTSLANAVLRLPHGDIVAAGAFHGERSTLAVTGGTGRYKGAGGTLTHGAENAKGIAKITVRLLP